MRLAGPSSSAARRSSISSSGRTACWCRTSAEGRTTRPARRRASASRPHSSAASRTTGSVSSSWRDWPRTASTLRRSSVPGNRRCSRWPRSVLPVERPTASTWAARPRLASPPHDALAHLPATVSALCVGTLGLVLEPMATASEALVEAVHGRAPVLVDPNIRPALITDRASYLARLWRVVAHADVVKLSDEDLAWIDSGRPEDAAVAAMLDAGPRLVVLTRGAGGVSGYTLIRPYRRPRPSGEGGRHDRRRRFGGRRDPDLPARARCRVAGRTRRRGGAAPLRHEGRGDHGVTAGRRPAISTRARP